jgi:hypothetical protein
MQKYRHAKPNHKGNRMALLERVKAAAVLVLVRVQATV